MYSLIFIIFYRNFNTLLLSVKRKISFIGINSWAGYLALRKQCGNINLS
jgi:hypothetical protein